MRGRRGDRKKKKKCAEREKEKKFFMQRQVSARELCASCGATFAPWFIIPFFCPPFSQSNSPPLPTTYLRNIKRKTQLN